VNTKWSPLTAQQNNKVGFPNDSILMQQAGYIHKKVYYEKKMCSILQLWARGWVKFITAVQAEAAKQTAVLYYVFILSTQVLNTKKKKAL
jgi:hypothetical protein